MRRYSSDGRAAAPYDPARAAVAPEWFGDTGREHARHAPVRLAAALRGADRARRGDPDAEGVWAPPGEYTVTLAVDGRRQSQPLTVEPDPRVALPPEAYRAEFDLAREVEEMQADVAAAAKSTETLIAALSRRRQTVTGPLAEALHALEERAWDLAGTAPSANRYNRWGRAPRSVTSWRFLSDTLKALATAIDGADAEPTPDAREGVAKAKPALEAVHADAARLETDLAALDARLVAAGESPVRP